MNATVEGQVGLRVQQVSGSIGAEVSGVRLADLSDAEFAVIHRAFLDHCMLVFRGQHLSMAEHVAFAGRWGRFDVNPLSPYRKDFPMILELENRGKSRAVTENWHYDSTFEKAPPAITILSARDIPVGGDTMWCNQYRAYERLSPGMQRLLEGVRAEFTGARLAKLYGLPNVPTSFHPVVRTPPETGRKALFIGRPGDTVPRLEDMTVEDSAPLLQYLYEHSIRPDNIYRHHWQNGDVVMWDNRCTMHYAVHDYGDEAVRSLHRITIAGDVPR